MNTRFPLACAAALIADPARAAMLTTMLEGRSFAAGELARAANISAQSASMHLSQLLDGEFVKVTQVGRHRYYRIASSEVAHAIESLGVISTPHKPKRPRGTNDALCYARTCYDHLAGELAVSLAEAWESEGLLAVKDDFNYHLTATGERHLADWQIDTGALRTTRRHFAKRCLDWTERRPHIAGALGAALYRKFLEFRWITRDQNSRVVRLTALGSPHLQSLLDQRAAGTPRAQSSSHP